MHRSINLKAHLLIQTTSIKKHMHANPDFWIKIETTIHLSRIFKKKTLFALHDFEWNNFFFIMSADEIMWGCEIENKNCIQNMVVNFDTYTTM